MRAISFAPRPTGRLVYTVLLDGQPVEQVDEPNLVVTQALTILAHGLAGDTASGAVKLFGVGTNLAAPAMGNTGLTGAYTNAVSAAVPVAGQVAFSFALQSGEANGMAIGEFGLLSQSGLLFARKVRQVALVKSAGVSLSGTWTISW